MTEALKLPVGIENFAEIRQAGFYYVDKTKFIEQLLDGWGKVNLFTRPRRFGKTLNMSMLRYFFEIGADTSLFDDLQIAKNKKLCEEYQGKYPVIFLSFKNVEGLTFADAQYRLAELIAGEAERFAFLAQSDKLTENERSLYCGLTAVREGRYALQMKSLFLPCSFYRSFYLSITDKKRLFCLMSTMCLWIRPFRMAIIRKWCHLSAVCSARP